MEEKNLLEDKSSYETSSQGAKNQLPSHAMWRWVGVMSWGGVGCTGGSSRALVSRGGTRDLQRPLHNAPQHCGPTVWTEPGLLRYRQVNRWKERKRRNCYPVWHSIKTTELAARGSEFECQPTLSKWIPTSALAVQVTSLLHNRTLIPWPAWATSQGCWVSQMG